MQRSLWRHHTINFPCSYLACFLHLTIFHKESQLSVKVMHERTGGLFTLCMSPGISVLVRTSDCQMSTSVMVQINNKCSFIGMLKNILSWEQSIFSLKCLHVQLLYAPMLPTAVAGGIMLLCCPFVPFRWTLTRERISPHIAQTSTWTRGWID